MAARIHCAIENVDRGAQVTTGNVAVVENSAAVEIRSEAFACEGLFSTFEQTLCVKVWCEGVFAREENIQTMRGFLRGCLLYSDNSSCIGRIARCLIEHRPAIGSAGRRS